ncbi:MAG: hypothetical protein Kow0031_29960 [Anaerolineae bacterium]
MPDQLIVLGSASALPTRERHLTAFALRVTGKLFLIDCGAPVSSLLYQSGLDPLDVQAVFLSHWHMDHVAGLGPFLIQNHLLKRTRSLKIYGPRGTQGKINRLLTDSFMLPEELAYKMKVTNVKAGAQVKESLLKVQLFRTQHLEKPKHKTHFGRKATAFGMVLQGPGWRVLYSGDLTSPQELAPYAGGSTLLVHELAHVEPEAVAEFAEAAQIPAVLVSHIDPKFDDSPGRIVKAFSGRYGGNLIVAHDGTKVQLSQAGASGKIKDSDQSRKRKKGITLPKIAGGATFLEILEKEMALTPEVSRKILAVAQSTLLQQQPAAPRAEADATPAGTVPFVTAALNAPSNLPLSDADRVTVTLTLDAGEADTQLKAEQGPTGLRRQRLLRLQQEAVAQGGMLTQADLARLLNASIRTIRRDIKALTAEGHTIRTRGQSE